jgi:hypothetical protein
MPVPRLRARCLPSPCGWLSQPRTTTEAPSHPGDLRRRRSCPSPTWLAGGKGALRAVPTFTLYPVDGMGAQLFPCGLAMGTPQSFPMASPPARASRLRSRPKACAAPRPVSTRLEPVTRFRGFHHWFTSCCTSPSRLPGLGHLVVLAHPVVVGAAPALPCASRVGLPPASAACCDRPWADSSFRPDTGASWRTHGPRITVPSVSKTADPRRG